MKKSVKKPWGGEEWFALNEKSTVKILYVNPKQKLSLQKHKHRKEFWKVLDNPVKITVGKKTFRAKKGDEIRIPKGAIHRIEGLSKPVRILEVAFGKFDPNDIIRIEDVYGRT